MRTKVAAMMAALVVISAAPLLAHHSFAAEFDQSKPVKVTGSVSKIEWTNPHIWIYVDVKESDGNVTTWGFQGGPPSYLYRAGWTRNSLKLGDIITVQGFSAKDGSKHASSRGITLPDGRKVFAGSAADTGGPQ